MTAIESVRKDPRKRGPAQTAPECYYRRTSPLRQFVSVAMTAALRNEGLVHADRTSLLLACADCARHGLLARRQRSGLCGPQKQRKSFWTGVVQERRFEIKEVVYMPMVQGIYKLANGSGDVARLSAQLVHEKDAFEYTLGINPTCTHVPARGDRGKVTDVYAVVKYKDGSADIEVMSTEEVETVRKMGKQPDGLMWSKTWGEGAKKSVIHRIAKRLDLAPAATEAIKTIEADHDFDGALLSLGTDALPPPRPELEPEQTVQTDPPSIDPEVEKAARDVASMGVGRLDAYFSQMSDEALATLDPIRKELDAIAYQADMAGGA